MIYTRKINPRKSDQFCIGKATANRKCGCVGGGYLIKFTNCGLSGGLAQLVTAGQFDIHQTGWGP